MKQSKTTFYGLVTAMFIGLMAMPQQAAGKKIEYLGHEYEGKMNKQGVPEGKGVMKIKNLLVSGVFADRIVTDASVYYLEQQGQYRGENSSFAGTVVYDESDILVLKAGGKQTIKYFEKGKFNARGGELQSSLVYDLPDDRIVDINYFVVPKKIFVTKETPFPERNWLNMCCGTYHINGNEVTPPSTLTSYVEYVFSPRNGGGLYCSVRETVSKATGTDNSEWSIINGNSPLEVVTVKYANGDAISFCQATDGYGHSSDTIMWKKTFKDGKQASAFSHDESFPTEKPHYVRYKKIDFSMDRKNIMELWKSDHLQLNSGNVNGFYLKDLPDNPTDKAVQEYINSSVLPLLDDKGKNGSFYVDLPGKGYGRYDNGVFTSEATRKKTQEAAEQKAEQQKKREEQQVMQDAYRKYGKKYVDAFVRGNILVGMPEELLLKWNNIEKKYDGGSTRKYWLYDNNLWNPKLVYTVWVTNGKVTDVSYH